MLNKYIQKNNILDKNTFLNLFPSVSFDEMQKIYSNSTLSLNITELRNTYVLNNPVHKLHLRTFEIPMSGGLQIVSFSDEISSYFEDQKEIVLYKSYDEFLSKSKFYLDKNKSSLVLKMKNFARKRSEKEHTWFNRFCKILDKI